MSVSAGPRPRWILGFALLLAWCTAGAAAQEEEGDAANELAAKAKAYLEAREKAKEAEEKNKETEPADEASGAGAAGNPFQHPPAPPEGILGEEVTAVYNDMWLDYYTYVRESYDHRRRTFEWQLNSSRVIFAFVLLLVLAGVYFAAVQFHVTLGRGGGGDGELGGELVASMGKVEVKSPVLGLLILVLSLAFFYLYLVYVYPIENTF